jgi:hypothetical protein
VHARRHNFRQVGVAAALLIRSGRQSVTEQCFLLWRTFVAEALAMQVIVMRERLQRADAECCVLRGEDERLRAEVERCKAIAGEAEFKSASAEGELRRRSQQEFAQFREVQVELAKLRAKSVASTVPAFHIDPVSAAAYSLGSAAVTAATEPHTIATVAGGMAASFTTAATRTWIRLYLLAWRSETSTQELVLAVASQSASAEACVLASRILALWRLHIRRGRYYFATLRLAELLQTQYLFSLLHAVLRSWHAHIDRISCLVTPLSLRGSTAFGASPLTTTADSVSHVAYHSAVARSAFAEESPQFTFDMASEQRSSACIPKSERVNQVSADVRVVPVQLWPNASPGV